MSTQELVHGVPGYVAGSADASRAVIVVQEAFGVNAHIEDVTERFAREGYFAVAPHLFHRDGSATAAYDDFPSAMGLLANLTQEGLESDLRHTVEFLDEAGFPTPSIGIVGYCMGGTVAFYADTLGLVGAAATYYGGGVINGRFGLPSLVDLAPHLQAPWRGFYGDLDKGIPVEQVEALRDAAATSGVSTDIIRYVDGDHGFHCDDRTAVFNENAAADAYARTLTFFGETLRDK